MRPLYQQHQVSAANQRTKGHVACHALSYQTVSFPTGPTTRQQTRTKNSQDACSTEKSQEFQCLFCDREFNTVLGQRSHMGKVHKEEWKELNDLEHCDYCKKPKAEFKDDRSFQSHRRKRQCEKKAQQCSSVSFQEHIPKPSESNAQSIPETHHMDESDNTTEMKGRFEPVQHDANPIENIERKPPLKFPPPLSKKWLEIEEDLCATLDGVMRCSGKNKFKSLPISELVELYENIVYDVLSRHCVDSVAVVQNHKQRSRQDRPGKLEKRLKAEKIRLRQEYKAAKRGETALSESELKNCSRKFHVT